MGPNPREADRAFFGIECVPPPGTLHVQPFFLPGTLTCMEGEETDDRGLVTTFLARRDEESFRALYSRHTPAIHGFSLRVLGRSARLAEDVVQETWLRAARNLSGFTWRSSLRTWLLGIALNCSREQLRREGAFGPEEAPEPHMAPEPPDLDLERAFRSLPAGYREVLALHDVAGFTHAEIGELLGIEVGTSRSQLSRARRALRSRWAPLERAIFVKKEAP